MLLVFGFLGYGFLLWMTLELPRGTENSPVVIYGSPFVLEPGVHVQQSLLLERLNQLGYRQVHGPVRASGEYWFNQAFIDIFLHEVPQSFAKALPIRLYVENHRVTSLMSLIDDQELLPLSLEPPIISGVRGPSRELRTWVSLSSMPASLLDAVLVIEDQRFYKHHGIDPLGILRAVWVNLQRGRVIQGGSTLTQQLAKNVFLTHNRTWVRKFKEAMTAVVLEAKYSKQEILESYLNEIYLGQAGFIAVHGVGEGAHQYFGKSVEALTLAESALLAGLIKAPNTYSPWRNLARAKKRRDLVLTRLETEGIVSSRTAGIARDIPVQVTPVQGSFNDTAYFVDYLLPKVESGWGRGHLPPGSKILTTIDPVIQGIAVKALQEGLHRIAQQKGKFFSHPATLQGAVVVLNPRTGAIVAMVGGASYQKSQFNRAVQARRQPGSLLKPFVYLAAFDLPRTLTGDVTTPATIVRDEALTFYTGSRAWSPQNFDRQFRGPVTIRDALEQSLNVPVVRVAKAVGMQEFIRLCRNIGLEGPIEENLSVALGSSEVSLLEIVAAFGVLANSGSFVSPTPVRGVMASTGEFLWLGVSERHRVVRPEAAYLITSLLEGVVERGTAQGLKRYELRFPIAGKTGTTDGYRDAWFVGYTPHLVIGVWVGFDDGQSLGLTGSQAAMPIWGNVAKQIIPPDSPEFQVPAGIVTREIDPHSGQLATSRCPDRVEEVFIAGTEPTDYCPLHGVGWWDRMKSIFALR